MKIAKSHRWQSLFFASVAFVCWPVAASAQDDALEKLLRDVETKNAPDQKPADKDKPGTIGKEDSGLDDLLKKLGGGTADKPLPKGESGDGQKEMPKSKGTGDAEAQKPAEPGSTLPKPPTGLAGLKSRPDAELDQRLEEILGRKRKKKDQDQEGQNGEGQQGEADPSNPEMKKLVEKMREVEKRLSEPDTGQDTRKKQTEIVESIDQIIQRMRQVAQQQQQQRRQRQQQQGQGMAQNDQPGEQPGAQARGVGPQTPQKPSGKSSLDGKDVWGHLPPELRDVMRNVFREESLPAREELVRRYYMSVSKKSLARSSTP